MPKRTLDERLKPYELILEQRARGGDAGAELIIRRYRSYKAKPTEAGAEMVWQLFWEWSAEHLRRAPRR